MNTCMIKPVNHKTVQSSWMAMDQVHPDYEGRWSEYTQNQIKSITTWYMKIIGLMWFLNDFICRFTRCYSVWYLVEHDGKEHDHLDSSLVCSCSRSKRNSISCTEEKRWSQPMSLLIILSSRSEYLHMKTSKAILKIRMYHTW